MEDVGVDLVIHRADKLAASASILMLPPGAFVTHLYGRYRQTPSRESLPAARHDRSQSKRVDP
jgi:hypothetical protein